MLIQRFPSNELKSVIKIFQLDYFLLLDDFNLNRLCSCCASSYHRITWHFQNTSADQNSVKNNTCSFVDCMFHFRSKWMSAQGNTFHCDSQSFETSSNFWYSVSCFMQRAACSCTLAAADAGWDSATSHLSALTARDPALRSCARISAPLR